MPKEYTGPFDGSRPNSQPIKKITRPHFSDRLLVHSIFHTIQGEGPFSGNAAVFVRLNGCNLQCPMCDTEYTAGADLMTPKAILYDIELSPLKKGGLVVISGGEPFRQNLIELFSRLTDAGYFVQVETNGTLQAPDFEPGYSTDPTSRQGVYIVCSPKTGKVHDSIKYRACCFKYVVTADAMDPEDGLPLSVLGLPNPAAKPSMGRDGNPILPVYMQPADEQDEAANQRNIKAATEAAMKHGYILQLQIHKYLGVE